MSQCRSCHAAVMWVETDAGKRMPLDSTPNDNDGNIVIRGGKAHYLKAGEQPGAGEHRWTSHFATCPHAAQHRRG